MKKVQYKIYVYPNGTNNIGEWETGIGLFHQWGNDYEEFENGPGNFTVGIIEKEDGSIIMVRADKVKFIK